MHFVHSILLLIKDIPRELVADRRTTCRQGRGPDHQKDYPGTTTLATALRALKPLVKYKYVCCF